MFTHTSSTSSSLAFTTSATLATSPFTPPTTTTTARTASSRTTTLLPSCQPAILRRSANFVCSTANINNGPLRHPFDPAHVPSSPLVPLLPSNDVQPLRIFGRNWHLSGRVMLILTPVLWGGYTVSVRLLYTLPWAISPSLFNLLRLCLAASIVLPGLIAHRKRHALSNIQKKEQDREQDQEEGHQSKKWFQLPVVRGGIEIGVWTFLVNVLQIAGLRYTSASRAAFLSQLNSIFVPFAAAALGMESAVGLSVYLASFLSVCGVGLFSLDDFASPFSLLGEGVLLLSAFAGAAFILRCKTHSSHRDSSVVIGMKICSQFLFSVLFFLPQFFNYFSPAKLSIVRWKQVIVALFTGATPWLIFINIALIVYNGVFISWLSSIFHVQGQNSVTASEAVIVFASTPIWSALYAIPLGERFGLKGMIGAAFIVFATMLASVKPRGKHSSQDNLIEQAKANT